MNFMRFITKNDGIYDKLEIINEDKSRLICHKRKKQSKMLTWPKIKQDIATVERQYIFKVQLKLERK